MKKSYSQLQREVVNQLLYDSSSASLPGIVPMEPDYNGEVRRCLTSVVFVPFTIAERIQSNIIERLREIAPTHYYYPPDTLHITIKNIRTGHAPPLFTNIDIEKCRSVFSEVSARHAPLTSPLEINRSTITRFLEALGLDEEPLGMIYTDSESSHGVSPLPQKPVSRKAIVKVL